MKRESTCRNGIRSFRHVLLWWRSPVFSSSPTYLAKAWSLWVWNTAARVSCSHLALSLPGTPTTFLWNIIQIFSNHLFRENWGWVIWQRTLEIYMMQRQSRSIVYIYRQQGSVTSRTFWWVRWWSRWNIRNWDCFRNRERPPRHLVAFFPTTETMLMLTRSPVTWKGQKWQLFLECWSC